jgi:N-acetyl-gamma-glutamyl-phosphate reductase
MEESAEEQAVARHLSGMPHADAEAMTGTDRLTIHVFANQAREQAVICAVLDNLGKGAAGQAVQNLELMLGLSRITDNK